MSAEEFSEKIQQALAVLPDKPGVYLMHDANGKVINEAPAPTEGE